MSRVNVQAVPVRVDPLRTLHTRRDAAHRDYLLPRRASARCAAGRGPTYFARGPVCEPEGLGRGVDAEGV